MADKFGLYKCNICGNIVEVFHAGPGTLACCGAEMMFIAENTVDASKEKHVPVAERVNGVVTVRVGSIPHPMEEKHYIEWIEVIAGGKVYRQHLQPGDTPEAVFTGLDGAITIREYCNLHGQWSAKAD